MSRLIEALGADVSALASPAQRGITHSPAKLRQAVEAALVGGLREKLERVMYDRDLLRERIKELEASA